MKNFVILFIVYLCTVPIAVGNGLEGLRKEIANREGKFVDDAIKTHLTDLGLVELPEIKVKINPVLSSDWQNATDDKDLSLDQLSIYIGITGNFGDNFKTHIKKHILHLYKEQGYHKDSNTGFPNLKVYVDINTPSLPLTAEFLSYLSIIFLVVGTFLVLYQLRQRYLFAMYFKNLDRKQMLERNFRTHENDPELGLLNDKNVDKETQQLFLEKGIGEDPFATACALKIAEICELQTSLGNEVDASQLKVELEEIENKLHSITLSDAIKILSKLDKKTKIEALKKLKISPILMASLLKK